jgi:EAL domain-containing protein (putative c-di-GMP-specific phosphodiesterase class I)
MNSLMGTARARTRMFLAASIVGILVLIGVASFLVVQSTAGVASTASAARATGGVDLLVTIGVELPSLTRSTLAGRFPPAVSRRLDGAVKRGQADGLLANLVVWDRTGRIVYTGGAKRSEGTRPAKDAQLVAALAGHTTTRTIPREIDPLSGKPTGLLEALEPLTDARGVVYGALEADLSRKPIYAAATQSIQRTVSFVVGGAVLVWLLLLPLWIRLARAQAKDWVPGRRRTIRAIREALDHGEMELVYQPQIEPGNWRVDGVEALVRWRRNGELVTPDGFLPAVESSGLMPRLTDRVLDLALAQLACWRSAGFGVRVSVNLSATDLADRTLPQRIATKLEVHRVLGEHLTVEVTETAVFGDAEQAGVLLKALREMGIDIALDDFGTGHGSISRLHAQEVFTEVKIDRSFVSDTQQRSRTYLMAMVGFGLSLGLRVVAEGVEDAETMAILTALNCDLAQGYLITRPLEPAAMTVWLTTAQSAASPEQALAHAYHASAVAASP